MFLEQIQTSHDLFKAATPITILSVMVVNMLRPINGYAYEEIVFREKGAPLIVE